MMDLFFIPYPVASNGNFPGQEILWSSHFWPDAPLAPTDDFLVYGLLPCDIPAANSGFTPPGFEQEATPEIVQAQARSLYLPSQPLSIGRLEDGLGALDPMIPQVSTETHS